MKKILISTILLFIIIFGLTYLNIKENKQDKKIKVAEVAHSIFYAPQYLAIKEGYFKEEGLNIELILTPGADAVMASVLSGDAQIGFSGGEAPIYVYNRGNKDYPVIFAGLTKKDGSFLISRKEIKNFTLNDLKGKTIIGGRKGGMPEMTLEWALKKGGLNINKDLKIDSSIAFAAMQGAFIGGNGDFVTLFEPNATLIEKKGYGHIVAYVGSLGGEVPYTAYHARKSFIDNNPDTIKKFNKAINKGLKFVNKNNPEIIAEKIIDFFPDTNIEDLTKMIKRYKDGNAWKENTNINKKEWMHIQDIMIEAGELKEYVDYDKLIYSKNFANE